MLDDLDNMSASPSHVDREPLPDVPGVTDLYLSRRRIFKSIALTGLVSALAVLLAACGDPSGNNNNGTPVPDNGSYPGGSDSGSGSNSSSSGSDDDNNDSNNTNSNSNSSGGSDDGGDDSGGDDSGGDDGGDE